MLRAIFLMALAVTLFVVVGLLMLSNVVFPSADKVRVLKPMSEIGIVFAWFVSMVGMAEFLRTVRVRSVLRAATKIKRAAALSE